MLYSTLTTDELERLVYVNPDNAEAKAELLGRVPDLIDQENDALQDEKDRANELEKDFDRKAEELEDAEESLGELDDKLLDASSKIEQLEERIAELTYAEDLV